jgi:hypothetical protein
MPRGNPKLTGAGLGIFLQASRARSNSALASRRRGHIVRSFVGMIAHCDRGRLASQAGKLSVSGSYTQNSDGALNIELASGFVPTVGSTFTIGERTHDQLRRALRDLLYRQHGRVNGGVRTIRVERYPSRSERRVRLPMRRPSWSQPRKSRSQPTIPYPLNHLQPAPHRPTPLACPRPC